jgi:23S rRNA (cytidine1920-2'-O)/16S rRNA (cytidine1409-2'-O)-methyltransferase
MMTEKKTRLDTLLVERGLFPSREKARAAIMAGEVWVKEQRVLKPGVSYPSDSQLEVVKLRPHFVSRGGYKLAKALSEFGLDVQGKTLLDVGASTGGFTDCALKQGAALVFAVDVGYGQLDWSLRQDPRVKSLERFNIRNLKKEDIEDTPVDMATVDVSFISLRLVFPVLKALDIPAVVALVKPQFEAGREQVGRGGVVKDPKIHLSVLEHTVREAAEAGYHLQALTYSPIKGPKGNIEFLAYFLQGPPREGVALEKIVGEAHEALKK